MHRGSAALSKWLSARARSAPSTRKCSRPGALRETRCCSGRVASWASPFARMSPDSSPSKTSFRSCPSNEHALRLRRGGPYRVHGVQQRGAGGGDTHRLACCGLLRRAGAGLERPAELRVPIRTPTGPEPPGALSPHVQRSARPSQRTHAARDGRHHPGQRSRLLRCGPSRLPVAVPADRGLHKECRHHLHQSRGAAFLWLPRQPC